MLPDTDNYLAWARGVQDIIDTRPDICNLFSSAIAAPPNLLLADLDAPRADWQAELAEVSAWGHPGVIAGIAERCQVPIWDVFITSGASNAFVVICQAFVRAGDCVLLERPHYQPFRLVLEAVGARVRDLPRSADGFDLAQVERGLAEGTRMVVLSNLHNPTAALMARETLAEMARLAGRYDALVVVDETFHHLVDEPSAANLDENVIALGSLSKVYGLSALRCGWIIAAPPLHGKLRPALTLFENTLSSVAQAAAARAFAHLDAYRRPALERTAHNRTLVRAFAEPLLARGLIEGDVQGQGCVYFPRLRHHVDTARFTERLAGESYVIVVPGEFFGAPGHIRIGYGGDPARLEAGLVRLEEAIVRMDTAPQESRS